MNGGWTTARRRRAAAFVIASMTLLLVPASGWANPDWHVLLPNVTQLLSPTRGVQRSCITCHTDADGSGACVDGSELPGHVAPCLNPFGNDFFLSEVPGTLDNHWTQPLALMDSDGDGFTNGQELQDPQGTWLEGQPRPGNAAYATDPGSAEDHPGLHDNDADGHCWFGVDLDENGVCTGAAELAAGFDCDDADATVNSDAAEACSRGIDADCDGLVAVADPDCADVVDGDEDGFCVLGHDDNGDRDCLDAGESEGLRDCDDTTVTAHPGAPANCCDDIDNDCNDLIDLADPACSTPPASLDGDGDGFCPLGHDDNGDGDCLDAGETVCPADCDDSDPAISPAATEVCGDLEDNDCDGLANLADPDCRDYADEDGDAYCPLGEDLDGDGGCVDPGEQTGASDCDDTTPARNPRNIELCLDGIDNDCDELANLDDPDCAVFLDVDGDGFCPIGGEDANADGDCADEDELADGIDCNDANPDVHPGVDEVCFDRLDNDCNFLSDSRDPACTDYLDADGDGYCPAGHDLFGDGDCDEPGEQGGEVDCDDSDPAVHPGAYENCATGVDHDCDGLVGTDDDWCTGDHDFDGDGFCPLGRDINGDGDCLDDGEQTFESDCEEDRPDVNPAASESTVEECTDQLDNDCDGMTNLADEDCASFLDRDRDGFCPMGVDLNLNGNCLNAGEQTLASDCDDDDWNASPGQGETCDDGVDNDCDGLTDYLDTRNCRCTASSQCDDGDSCTRDVCRSGVCESTPEDPCGGGGDGDGDGGGAGGCGCAVPTRTGRGLPEVAGFVLLVWCLGRRARSRRR